jgi:hypothetical protein
MPTDLVRVKWNLMVVRNLYKAKQMGDYMMVAYWKEMFV